MILIKIHNDDYQIPIMLINDDDLHQLQKQSASFIKDNSAFTFTE